MARRNRTRRPARRAPIALPRRRLLVVCEGVVTEPSYIRGFEREVRNATVVIDIPDDQGDPKRLVEIAKDRRDRANREADREGDPFLRYDEVWCVFDVDEHARLAEAVQMADDNGIRLAVSNPCFELWLVLHFRESPGPRDRREVQRLLRTFLPGYDKHLEFARLSPGLRTAAERAKRLEDDANQRGEQRPNPSTGMHHLNASIARPSGS